MLWWGTVVVDSRNAIRNSVGGESLMAVLTVRLRRKTSEAGAIVRVADWLNGDEPSKRTDRKIRSR